MQTEYLYVSPRIRSMEAAMVGKERLARLTECKTSAESMAYLWDNGLLPKAEAAVPSREAAVSEMLAAAYREVDGMVPDPAAYRYLRYPYDCNNVKAAIKAFLRDVAPGHMTDPCGSYAADEVVAMVQKKDFSALPANMRDAASLAMDEFSKTGDPMRIDLCLDRACFSDMLAGARATGSELAVRLVIAQIDLVNIMTTVRLMRLGFGKNAGFAPRDAMPEGGIIPLDRLLSVLDGGDETRLYEMLTYTDYAAFAKVASECTSLAGVECAADNFRMEIAKGAKMIPFGFEVALGYLFGMEYSVKNLRILLAGKDAGWSAEAISERVRESYV